MNTAEPFVHLSPRVSVKAETSDDAKPTKLRHPIIAFGSPENI